MDRKKTLLIVDDDADDLMFFCEVLSQLDPPTDCITAENGEDALKILRTGKQLPHFIFLDLNMPKMDGRACLQILKKDEQLKDIPVIIFSTSTYLKDMDETRALGAAYFLPKPFDLEELHNEIALILAGDF